MPRAPSRKRWATARKLPADAADQLATAAKKGNSKTIRDEAPDAVIRAAANLNGPLANEMESLLKTRIAGFHHVVMTRLMIVLAMFVRGGDYFPCGSCAP